MVTWLTRSLLFIVVGAVLAYAVTVRNNTVDIQTTGVILLLVGIFDLLLNFGLTMYLRRPVRSEPGTANSAWSPTTSGRRRRAASSAACGRPTTRTCWCRARSAWAGR